MPAFSPLTQTKLIKINIQLLQNPQFLKAVVTCQAQNGIFFFFLFLDKFPFKLFPRNPAQILRNPFPTIFYGFQLRKILKKMNKKRKKKKMRPQLRHISVAFSQRRLQVTLSRFTILPMKAERVLSAEDKLYSWNCNFPLPKSGKFLKRGLLEFAKFF